MARIGSTLVGIERVLLNRLSQANAEISLSALRKATGHRINAPADDPSAFTTLSGLQAELTVVRRVSANAQSAGTVVSGAQSALSSVEAELGAIRTELLKDVDHSLTPEERAEAQAKIDAAISRIGELASTESAGIRTLDGSADFTYAGKLASQVSEVTVYARPGDSAEINAEVLSAATQAELTYSGDASDQVTDAATFVLGGARGEISLSVADGESLSDVAARINDQSHNTGVVAEVDGAAHTLTMRSVDYGSEATSRVTVESGTFVVTGGDGAGSAAGTDASATINGHTISADSPASQGNRITVNDNGFRFSIEFRPGFTGPMHEIEVQGKALAFNLSQDAARTSTLALPGVQPARLGGNSGTLEQLLSGGSLSGLGGNTSQSLRVVDEALADMGQISARVDGFYDSAVTSASGLMSALESKLTSAIDAIDQTNDEYEDARIAYFQGLASNAVSGMAILDQQRSNIVSLIRQIAGLGV
ncbi:MAG: flagellin hook IN motif-containing protein [Planctomycetota bacterium]